MTGASRGSENSPRRNQNDIGISRTAAKDRLRGEHLEWKCILRKYILLKRLVGGSIGIETLLEKGVGGEVEEGMWAESEESGHAPRPPPLAGRGPGRGERSAVSLVSSLAAVRTVMCSL